MSNPPPPGQTPQQAAYPPQPGAPPHQAYPPPGSHAAPPPAYDAQPYPPAYPPYPRRSGAKTFWIVLAAIVGTLVVVGGGLYMVLISGGFEGLFGSRHSEVEPVAFRSSPDTAPETTASRTLVGRWCVQRGYTQFNADGTLVGVNSGRTQYGTWQEVSAGRINMTTGGQTIAANYVIAGNYLSITSSSGATGQFTRC